MTFHFLNYQWKKVRKSKNEDEEISHAWAIIKPDRAKSHDQLFVLLLVCGTCGYREAKAVKEGRLQNLKEIISYEIFKSKYSKKSVSQVYLLCSCHLEIIICIFTREVWRYSFVDFFLSKGGVVSEIRDHFTAVKYLFLLICLLC